MDDSNIGSYNFGTQNPNGSPVGGTDNVQAPPPVAPSPPPSQTESTISKSELDQLALLMLIAAGFPILVPPIDGTKLQNSGDAAAIGAIEGAKGAYTALVMTVESKKNEIINSMWDQYLDKLHEFAERVRKEDQRDFLEGLGQTAKTAAEYLAYLFYTSAIKTVEGTVGNDSRDSNSALAVQFDNTFKQWMTPDGTLSPGSTDYPSATFIAGALAANVDLLKDSVALALVLDFKISTSPVADALLAVGPASGLPGDYQAAAAMIAALLNGGAVYKSTRDTIEQAANTGKPSRDLGFALNYAKNIMAIVTRPMDKGEQGNPLRAAQNQMIRLMLSTMALNLVYRSALGGMSGKELKDLLDEEDPTLPNAKFPEEMKAIMPQIQELVSAINRFLPKDPQARAEMISRLMEYVDSKKSVDSMLQTTKDYNEMLKTSQSVENNRQVISD